MKYLTTTPDIADMVNDLSQFWKISELAKYCGLTQKKLKLYVDGKEQVPQSVRMSLFWISTWGRDFMQIDSQNEAQTYRSLVRCLKEENRNLLEAISMLEQELHGLTRATSNFTIAANEHYLDPSKRRSINAKYLVNRAGRNDQTYFL